MELLQIGQESLSPSLAAGIRSNQSLWIGTLSFEDRCIASMRILREHHAKMGSAIALEYPTTVYPAPDDIQKRLRNKKTLVTMANDIFSKRPIFRPINPYSSQDINTLMANNAMSADVSFVLFDITCMTKLHTLALASYLARYPLPFRWACSYNIPENYGFLSNPTKPSGWKDVIIAPLAETAQLFNESYSRGIVVTGHEADRLLIAISEMEPAGGLIVLGETPLRPDLGRLSEKYNKTILSQLTKMRSSKWTRMRANMFQLTKLRDAIMEEIRLAKEANAPVILFPFGPKPLLFEVAYLMAKHYRQSSWFVYPVPFAYDVNYTEGIGPSYWFTATSGG